MVPFRVHHTLCVINLSNLSSVLIHPNLLLSALPHHWFPPFCVRFWSVLRMPNSPVLLASPLGCLYDLKFSMWKCELLISPQSSSSYTSFTAQERAASFCHCPGYNVNNSPAWLLSPIPQIQCVLTPFHSVLATLFSVQFQELPKHVPTSGNWARYSHCSDHPSLICPYAGLSACSLLNVFWFKKPSQGTLDKRAPFHHSFSLSLCFFIFLLKFIPTGSA